MMKKYHEVNDRIRTFIAGTGRVKKLISVID